MFPRRMRDMVELQVKSRGKSCTIGVSTRSNSVKSLPKMTKELECTVRYMCLELTKIRKFSEIIVETESTGSVDLLTWSENNKFQDTLAMSRDSSAKTFILTLTGNYLHKQFINNIQSDMRLFPRSDSSRKIQMSIKQRILGDSVSVLNLSCGFNFFCNLCSWESSDVAKKRLWRLLKVY